MKQSPITIGRGRGIKIPATHRATDGVEDGKMLKPEAKYADDKLVGCQDDRNEKTPGGTKMTNAVAAARCKNNTSSHPTGRSFNR